jgi:hypothetical protein
MSILAVAAFLMTMFDGATTALFFSAALMLFGTGLGLIFPMTTTVVQNAVPRDLMGTATASSVMFRQIGGSMSVAVFGAIFAANMAATAGLPDAASLSPAALAALPEAMKTAAAVGVSDALHPVYWIVMGLGLIGLALSLVLREIPLVNRIVPKGE